MTEKVALSRLTKQYPWPSVRPSVRPVDWRLDGGGRKLITDAIRKNGLRLILEVGVFLGGSVKTWLESSPDVVVLAVDPWEPPWGHVARRFGRPDIAAQLDRDDGPYETFLASLWEYRDRVIPIRGYSPDILYEIASAGVTPQLVYLDGDKTGQELEICSELFPGIVISGDDWLHGDENGFPIRQPVRNFCRSHSKHLRTNRHTWLISDQRQSFMELVKRPIELGHSAERRIRHLRKRFFRGISAKRAA